MASAGRGWSGLGADEREINALRYGLPSWPDREATQFLLDDNVIKEIDTDVMVTDRDSW